MRTVDLCYTSARDLASLIRSRQLSAREVMHAFLDRINSINPHINAIVAKLDDEECLKLAEQADHALARGDEVGPLHGLPWAFKDLEAAVGFPLTSGSPIYQHYMPGEDTIIVERIRRAGAIPIGKTNVPEFGMGSHTYNRVYGTTRNPYDFRKSAGGSSGGAAAAIAAGLLPAADGSDLGGSLRNPASFNNIVGFRPSVGLVPISPSTLPFLGFGVKGPLARSAADIALVMSVLAGADSRDPGGYPSDPAMFMQPLERDVRGIRLAWSVDLGGLPMDSEVRDIINRQRKTFEDLGSIVDDACPDFEDADDIFMTLRQWRSWIMFGSLLDSHRDLLKPEARWEIESGKALTSEEVARAMTRHAAFLQRVSAFQQRYDFFVCAVSQVAPFEASLDWPHDIEGTPMETYVSWMKSAYWVSVMFCPAISVPAGFTADGLPVGLQIVGRRFADYDLLQFAHAFELANDAPHHRPRLRATGS